MITLEKLLTELNSGSLNEIIAGGNCGKGGKGNNGHKSKNSKGSKSSKSAKASNCCVCYVPPKPNCPPNNHGCM